MAWDCTTMREQASRFLTERGEAVTVKRVSLIYTDNPPTETWAASGVPTIAFQSTSGFFIRHDAGILAEATHWAIGNYAVDIVQGDRIFRAGITDYYLTLRVGSWGGYKEFWFKYVAGVV